MSNYTLLLPIYVTRQRVMILLLFYFGTSFHTFITNFNSAGMPSCTVRTTTILGLQSTLQQTISEKLPIIKKQDIFSTVCLRQKEVYI